MEDWNEDMNLAKEGVMIRTGFVAFSGAFFGLRKRLFLAKG